MSGDGVRGDRPPQVPLPSSLRLRSAGGARRGPLPFSRLGSRPGGDSGGVCPCQGVPAPDPRPRQSLLGTARDVARFGGVGLTGLFCVPRLWHQLTLQVLDFVQDPCFAQGDGLIKVSGLFPAFLAFCTRKNSASLLVFLILLENY